MLLVTHVNPDGKVLEKVLLHQVDCLLQMLLRFPLRHLPSRMSSTGRGLCPDKGLQFLRFRGPGALVGFSWRETVSIVLYYCMPLNSC
jgi:hypothetical protein